MLGTDVRRLATAAGVGSRLAVRSQLVVDLVHIAAEGSCGLALQQRSQMLLRIALEGVAVRLQVDGQIRDKQHRLLDIDQLTGQLALRILVDHLAGYRQVTVEPRTPNTATIRRDSYLENVY